MNVEFCSHLFAEAIRPGGQAAPPWWLAIYIPGLLIGVILVLAYASGWRTLARRFRATKRYSGRRFFFVPCNLGNEGIPVRYGGALCVTLSPEGVRISFLFRLFHPPLFIPVEAITHCARRKKYFWKVTVLSVDGFWGKLQFFGAAGEAIHAYCAKLGIAGDGDGRWGEMRVMGTAPRGEKRGG